MLILVLLCQRILSLYRVFSGYRVILRRGIRRGILIQGMYPVLNLQLIRIVNLILILIPESILGMQLIRIFYPQLIPSAVLIFQQIRVLDAVLIPDPELIRIIGGGHCAGSGQCQDKCD
jgi:hypothetical protein